MGNKRNTDAIEASIKQIRETDKPKVNKEALEQSIKDKQKVINGKKIVRK